MGTGTGTGISISTGTDTGIDAISVYKILKFTTHFTIGLHISTRIGDSSNTTHYGSYRLQCGMIVFCIYVG
jgi:hypothetical protein